LRFHLREGISERGIESHGVREEKRRMNNNIIYLSTTLSEIESQKDGISFKEGTLFSPPESDPRSAILGGKEKHTTMRYLLVALMGGLFALISLGLLGGCASVREKATPPTKAEIEAAAVQATKDRLDQVVADSVLTLGPQVVVSMVQLTNRLTPDGLILFHVVTTEELAARGEKYPAAEYAGDLAKRVEPGLNKVDVMSVRVVVQRMGDLEVRTFWSVIARRMLEMEHNEAIDRFFRSLED
jgi:hypothetical protein